MLQIGLRNPHPNSPFSGSPFEKDVCSVTLNNMALTKDAVLAEFRSLEIPIDVHEHAEVLTVEGQKEALKGIDVVVAKNLFLKDKRNRIYALTLHEDTKVELKDLSARLGTGKGGIRMAPEELLGSILQVPTGCVTPIAACQPSASNVVLLLDEKLKSVEKFCVHPMENSSSVALSADGLETFLKAHNREAIYVNFEIVPVINKDNPPDLRAHAEAMQPYETGETKASNEESKATQKSGKGGKKAQGKSGNAKKGSGSDASQAPADDVNAFTQMVLDKVGVLVGDGPNGSDALKTLTADLQMEINAFRNAAYTRGYLAARNQVSEFCSGTYR